MAAAARFGYRLRLGMLRGGFFAALSFCNKVVFILFVFVLALGLLYLLTIFCTSIALIAASLSRSVFATRRAFCGCSDRIITNPRSS